MIFVKRSKSLSQNILKVFGLNLGGFGQNLEDFAQNLKNYGQNPEDFCQNLKYIGISPIFVKNSKI